MHKLDRRFIALGLGDKDLNLEVLPDGATRKALTDDAQTIDGLKTFSTTPRTLGSVSNVLDLVNKAYVDVSIQNALQGIKWRDPVEVVGAIFPTEDLYDGYRFINLVDNKIYTYVTDNWDTGVEPEKNWTVICSSTDEQWTYNDDTNAWIVSHSSGVPLATKDGSGKVQIGDGLLVSTGVISLALATNSGLVLDGTTPNKELMILVDNETSGLTLTSDGLAINLESLSASLVINASNELGVRLKGAGSIQKGPEGIYVDPNVLYEHYEEITLTETDIDNKYVSLTENIDVRQPQTSKLYVVGSPIQIYGMDYVIESDGTYIRRIFWGAKGLDGVLEENDTIRIWYNV